MIGHHATAGSHEKQLVSRPPNGDQVEESRDLLTSAIHALPVPGAPPKLSRANAWVGLSFLETALRQNHVRRISETLHLTEHHVSNRVVELDISLNLLDDIQSTAGLEYSAIRTRRAHTSPVKPEDQLLWVPVARLSKRSVSPVGVYDAHGALVPRLTQFESSKLLASGMYQLLRSILRAGTEVGERGRTVNQILTGNDEVRWLLQSALLTLFVERAGPTTPTRVDELSGDRLPDRSSKQRGLAARVLQDEGGVLHDYYRLLDVALQEYLIIVGLPNSMDEHHLRYTVPMAAEHSVGGRAKSRLRQLAPGWRGYRVSYETNLPSTVRSYHLVAETDPSLLVKKLVMTCDADRGTTERLVSDLSNLAPRLADPPGSATDTGPRKILELELETTIRTLSEFVRRRTWEAQQAGGMLHPKRTEAVQILAAAGVGGHTYPSGDGLHRASLLSNPQVTPGRLKSACAELDKFGFRWDLTHQADPPTHRAIAYWRHHEAIDPGADLYKFKSSVLITDAANGTSNVGGFVLAVMVITYVVGASVFGQPKLWLWKEGPAGSVEQSGLIIAVLLLVPGYLYSRLGSYQRTSVAAQVRFRPRFTAYCCIGSVALLAAFITGSQSKESFGVALWVALAVQAALATVLLLGRLRAWGLHAWQREVLDASPKWFYIRKRLRATPVPKQAAFDARFNSER